MDHAHYLYSSLPGRTQTLLEPGLHAYTVLHLEHWDFEAPPDAVRDPRMVGEFGSFSPDYRSWSQREYGLRIGVYRVLDALADAGIHTAVAANALVLPRVPELVQILMACGAEWLGHGLAATRMMHSGQPLDEQRSHIAQALQAIASTTGTPARGWLSQDWGTTPETYALLADAGLDYTLDWGNDDQPYWMCSAGAHQRQLLALPFSAEWDDVQCQWLRNIDARDHAQLVLDGARRMAMECARDQRAAVLGLGLHPWVWGMPSRIASLRWLLAELAQVPGLRWQLPGTLAHQCTTPHHPPMR
jgi:peptidoglycan/xylan/chitin deacetylase (PgdA/CDA1 family)